MQIDELRGELVTLADEIEGFEHDVDSLHRRARRRRIVVSAIVAAMVLIVGASTIAVARHDDAGHVQVAAHGTKEVTPNNLNRIDVVVVPASPDVQAVLDASSLVRRYSRVPRADRSSPPLSYGALPRAAFCALQDVAGFAVEATAAGSATRQSLLLELANKGRAFDVADYFGLDAEVFMKVGVPARAITSTLARLESDDAVSFVHFVSTTDAYELFKKEFADQPALIERTKPSDLPASFQINLRTGYPIDAIVQRYEHKSGVDAVIKDGSRTTQLFDPGFFTGRVGGGVSPCTKP